MRGSRVLGLVVIVCAMSFALGCSTFSDVGDTVTSGWNSLTDTVGGAVDSIAPSKSTSDSDEASAAGRPVYGDNADGKRPSAPASDGHGAFRMP